MKLLLTYQGTVKIAGQDVQLAGYEIGEDLSTMNNSFTSLLDTIEIDSAANSSPVDNPEVMVSMRLGVLPSLPTSNGSSGNGASSPAPMTTSSPTATPASGGSSQPSGGPRTGAAGTHAPSPSASPRAAGR